MTYAQVPLPAWQPPAVRPPLQPRQKRGAAIAGAVSFLLLSFGFALFSIPVSLLAFGAFFLAIFSFVGNLDDDSNRGAEQFFRGLDQFHLDQWIWPLVVVAVLGLAIMIAAMFLSASILKSHAVAKPWGVTWAGAGIAIVGSWVVSGVLSVVAQVISAFAGRTVEGDWTPTLVIGGASVLLGFAASAVIGWLAWWWMAHAMRSPAPN